jgi:hypothetical protein
MKCPTCDGEGSWVEYVSQELGGPTIGCGRCGETGRVSLWNVVRERLWDMAPEWFMDDASPGGQMDPERRCGNSDLSLTCFYALAYAFGLGLLAFVIYLFVVVSVQ